MIHKLNIRDLITLSLIILSINIASSEMWVSDAGVKYEQRILDEFNNSNNTMIINETANETWVSVIIYLKDKSEINNLISAFSDEEIRNILDRSISPNKISFEITRKGFDKLIEDGKVDKVYYNAPVYAFLDENNFTNFKNLYVYIPLILLILIILGLIIYKSKNRKKR